MSCLGLRFLNSRNWDSAGEDFAGRKGWRIGYRSEVCDVACPSQNTHSAMPNSEVWEGCCFRVHRP